MKCPKCGYVSFEYLDQCKSCGKSLESFKSEHGLYGYQPKDLMVAEYLEEKARAEEEAAVEETGEEGVVTVVEEEDGSLENIVSGIKGVTEGSEEPAEEISLDLDEADTAGNEGEKIAADLEKSEETPAEKESYEIELSLDEAEPEAPAEEAKEVTEEKESGEIELTLDEVEVEETKTPATDQTEKKDLEDDMAMELEDFGADLEIDDEITLEEPKSEKKDSKKKEDDKGSDDEIELELE